MVLISVILLACLASHGQGQSAGPTQTSTPPQTSDSQAVKAEQKPTDAKPPAQQAQAPKTPDPKTPDQKTPDQKSAQPATPSTKTAPKDSKAKGPQKGATSDKPTTDLETARTTYRIGPLDVLIIRVWENPNLTGTYDVRSDGMLSMQLIGEVKASNLTVEQLKAELGKRIIEAGQKNPDVDVQVARVNSKKYYVTGAVRKTGEFPLPEPITVLDAIILAGGPSDFAKQTKCYLLRDGHKWEFNYKNLLTGKDMSKNYVVFPGDRIVMPGE